MKPLHMGWNSQEEGLLFAQVREAREQGLPLKAVFQRVAAATGRRPNSVRNYYYARVKEDGSLSALPGGVAFVPFTQGEVRELLRTVLTAQAKGVSVRACTLSMGRGDNKAMLRYQNKYRSLVKGNPALVRAVRAELLAEGLPAADPYAEPPGRQRVGRPRKPRLEQGELWGKLGDIEGFEGFLLGLSRLLAQREAAEGALEEARAAGEARLLESREQMGDCLKAREKELEAMRERFNTLLSLYRQLLAVSRELLGMSGAVPSALKPYIRDLSRNVEDCERLLPEII